MCVQWDIESGLWASPFFGAFGALRFFSLALLGQLLLCMVAVYTTDGLAFPGCECCPTSRRLTNGSRSRSPPQPTNLKTPRVLRVLAPGIVFSLAAASVGTGFPGWWEPMTNKHLWLHMIVACISAGNAS